MAIENDDTNTKTAELLASFIERLSDKDKADAERDKTERDNAKTVKNLYLGIIASILSIFGAVIVQYGAPPKVAEKSDIIDVIKNNQNIIRKDPWTSIQDIAAMAALRKETYNAIKENATDRYREQELDQRNISHSFDRVENAINTVEAALIEHDGIDEHKGARIRFNQIFQDHKELKQLATDQLKRIEERLRKLEQPGSDG